MYSFSTFLTTGSAGTSVNVPAVPEGRFASYTVQSALATPTQGRRRRADVEKPHSNGEDTNHDFFDE